MWIYFCDTLGIKRTKVWTGQGSLVLTCSQPSGGILMTTELLKYSIFLHLDCGGGNSHSDGITRSIGLLQEAYILSVEGDIKLFVV